MMDHNILSYPIGPELQAVESIDDESILEPYIYFVPHIFHIHRCRNNAYLLKIEDDKHWIACKDFTVLLISCPGLLKEYADKARSIDGNSELADKYEFTYFHLKDLTRFIES